MPFLRFTGAFASLGLAVLFSSCQVLEGLGLATPRSRSEKYLGRYARNLADDIAKLEQLRPRRVGDEPPATEVMLAEATCDSVDDSVHAFSERISEYKSILAELEKNWSKQTVTKVRESLSRTVEIRRELADHLDRLSLLLDQARGEQDGLGLRPEIAGGQISPLPTADYIATLAELVEHATHYDRHFADVHSAGMMSKSPQATEYVFHFLSLHELGNVDLSPHRVGFEVAWKNWTRTELEAGRLASAMGVVSLVSTESGPYRQESFQEAFEIAEAAVRAPPSRADVAALEADFAAIAAALDGRARGGARIVKRVRARLVLCRAFATDDPERAAELAGQALGADPHLGEKANRFILEAARRAGDRSLAEQKYDEAAATYERILVTGRASNTKSRVARYRTRVVQHAASDVERAVAARDWALARGLLMRATRVSNDQRDRSLLARAFYGYYQSYSAALLERDPERTVSVCREALEVFPKSTHLAETLDRALFAVLRKKIGEVETSHERLTADQVLDAIKTTVREMRTDLGTGLCHRYLRNIEASWRRHAESVADPEQAFELALGLARLDHRTGTAAKEFAGAFLASRISMAVQDRRWAEVERFFDSYFALCPEVKRPDGFREDYVEFTEHLDASGDLDALAKHLVVLSKAYPTEREHVTDLLLRHLDASGKQGERFLALLRSIDPGHPRAKTRGPEARQQVVDAQREFDAIIDSVVGESIDDDEKSDWWTEEDDVPLEDDDSGGEEVVAGPPPVTYEFGRLSIAGLVVGGVGAVGLGVLVGFLTMKRRVFQFRWFAIVALWVGVTVGFVLGARAAREDYTPAWAREEAADSDR